MELEVDIIDEKLQGSPIGRGFDGGEDLACVVGEGFGDQAGFFEAIEIGEGLLERVPRGGGPVFEKTFERCSVLLAGTFEGDEDGQGDLAFGEVGAQGFSGGGLGAEQVEAIVVDLVSGAEGHAVAAQGLEDGGGGLAEEGAHFAGQSEELCGFHFDHTEVFCACESHVTAILVLENFATAHSFGGARYGAADLRVRELGSEFERVRKETIADEDGQTCAPIRGEGGAAAADPCAIHDIIMNQCGEVDHFDDRSDGEVILAELACGTAGESEECGADLFTLTCEGVAGVVHQLDLEGGCLILDFFRQLRQERFDGQEQFVPQRNSVDLMRSMGLSPRRVGMCGQHAGKRLRLGLSQVN